MNKNLSKQRLWQIRQVAEGNCIRCGKKKDRRAQECESCYNRKTSRRHKDKILRIYGCSFCHVVGHNTRTCRFKEYIDNTKIVDPSTSIKNMDLSSFEDPYIKVIWLKELMDMKIEELIEVIEGGGGIEVITTSIVQNVRQMSEVLMEYPFTPANSLRQIALNTIEDWERNENIKYLILNIGDIIVYIETTGSLKYMKNYKIQNIITDN